MGPPSQTLSVVFLYLAANSNASPITKKDVFLAAGELHRGRCLYNYDSHVFPTIKTPRIPGLGNKPAATSNKLAHVQQITSLWIHNKKDDNNTPAEKH